MADSWRLARSLEVLRDEIRSLHPGTTVWTIGDAAHRASWSDHNPTSSGVVCAIDVLGDKGLDLRAFANHLKQTNHRAVKYVIFDRRIWSKARSSEGWRRYYGSNPHTSHVHVSVGVGPDGRSTGPYDDTSPWGIANLGGGSVPGGGSTGTNRSGDSGSGVRDLQRDLNEALGLDLTVDGIYGPATTAAVETLQRRAGIAVDGIYGPDSRRALTELLEDDMPTPDEYAEAVWKHAMTSPLDSDDTMAMHVPQRWGYAVARETRERVKRVEAMQSTLLAAASGLTEEQITAAVAEGVRQGLPDAAAVAAEVVEAVIDRLEGELDASTLGPVMESALREVLGGLDESE